MLLSTANNVAIRYRVKCMRTVLPMICKITLKGIVQRKLRWVESVVNRYLVFKCRGAGYFYFILKGQNPGFLKKRFSASSAQIIGNVGRNR